MRFRNSLHLLIDNFGVIYKMLLYKLVVMIVTVSIALAFVIPSLSYIFESAELQNCIDTIQDFFRALFSGNMEYLVGFQTSIAESFYALGTLVSSKISHIVGAVIGIVFTYILFRFLDTVGNFAFGSMIDDKMNSYADISFFASLVKTLGAASVYAIFYVLMSFVYDVLLIFLCYLIFFALLSAMPLLVTLFFSVTVIFVCEALKLTIISNWMPSVIEGHMPVVKAFRDCFRTKVPYKARMFSNYLIALYLIVVFNVVFAACTMLSSLLLTVPASFLLLLCLQFVNYYTVEGKKYFVNYYKIADNKDKGMRSKFVDESDIKEENF